MTQLILLGAFAAVAIIPAIFDVFSSKTEERRTFEYGTYKWWLYFMSLCGGAYIWTAITEAIS